MAFGVINAWKKAYRLLVMERSDERFSVFHTCFRLQKTDHICPVFVMVPQRAVPRTNFHRLGEVRAYIVTVLWTSRKD